MFKQPEKKAKAYVREELKEVESLPALPIEQQIEVASEEFAQEMAKETDRLNKIDAEGKLLTRFAPLKYKLVHLFITGQYNNTQIARILGVDRQTVAKWLQTKEVKDMIESYQQEEDVIINASLKALRTKAINKYSELMDSDNDMVSYLVARDTLEKTGHKAVEKQQVDINISYEQKLQSLLEDKEVQADYTIHGGSSEEQINTGREDK
jgi:DNA-binding MarR family transcriptional regulator